MLLPCACCRLLVYFASGKACKACSEEQDDSPEVEVTYESALLSANNQSGRSKLAGTATYRMPHHPRYQDLFENAMYKPIWFKAFGKLRFTQLVGLLMSRLAVCTSVSAESAPVWLQRRTAKDQAGQPA